MLSMIMTEERKGLIYLQQIQGIFIKDNLMAHSKRMGQYL